MAGNALEILQMSCFCASFIVWNGYIPNSRKLHVQSLWFYEHNSSFVVH